jgi:hypothetical protein
MPTPRTTIPDLPEQAVVVDANLLVVQDGATTKKMTVGRLTTQNSTALAAHVDNASDAHDASAISAASNVAPMIGADVQTQLGQAAGALAGAAAAADAVQAALDAHIADPNDAHDASAVSLVAPPAPFNQTDVQAWANQVSASVALATTITDHLNDPTDAHDASAIAATPNVAPMVGDEVQTQLTQAATELGVLHAEIDALGTPLTTEDAVDATAAAFAAGTHTNVTVTYDDVANSISLAASGGGGGITAEDAVDATAAAFAAGTHTNVTVTYNDAANSISLAASGGGGGVTDGDKGDIVVSGGGATWMFDSSVVTAAGKALLDDASASAQRTTLGVDSIYNNWYKASEFTPAALQFNERTDNGTNYVTLGAPAALAGDYSITLPAASGTLVTTTQTIDAVAGTTYTVASADAGKIKRLAATATVTLPSGGPTTGQRVDFVCVGGPATFALGAGATWDVAPTPSAVARAIGSVVSAVKMGATTWMLTGDLA